MSAGDEILTVDGKVMADWFDVLYSTKLSPGRTLTVRYRRDSSEHEVQMRPVATGPEKTGEIGVHPLVFILSVDPGSPAEAAGLRADDAILTVDGHAVPTTEDVAPLITASAGRPVVVRLLRQGLPLELTATPRVDAGVPRIGIRLGERIVVRQYGPVGALRAALRRTWDMTTQIVDVLRRLVTARISVRTMAGPLGIARESGNAARAGGLAFFGFIAFISLNVGLLNLFPMTPLDGGHMLLLSVEGAFRRDLSHQDQGLDHERRRGGDPAPARGGPVLRPRQDELARALPAVGAGHAPPVALTPYASASVSSGGGGVSPRVSAATYV